MLGTYNYSVWINDSSGNSNISATQMFVISDSTLPEIANVDISTSDPLDTNPAFGWINITCDVTDNVAVDEVYLNITNPDSSFANVSMTKIGTNHHYYYNTSFSQHGNYSYFIVAYDTSSNVNTSTVYEFSMPPNWDIDANGVCEVLDLVLVSNHYGETGADGWIREDVDNNGRIQVLDLVLVSNHYHESWYTGGG